MPPCNRICQATTMRRTAGIKNNIGTRVETREKGSDRLPPHSWHAVEQYDSPSNATPRPPAQVASRPLGLGCSKNTVYSGCRMITYVGIPRDRVSLSISMLSIHCSSVTARLL